MLRTEAKSGSLSVRPASVPIGLKDIARGYTSFGERDRLCLGIYYRRERVIDSILVHYYFFLGKESIMHAEARLPPRLSSNGRSAELLTCKVLPRKWATEALVKYVGSRPRNVKTPLDVGYATYRISLDAPNLAVTSSYHPKSSFSARFRERRITPQIYNSLYGLPYYMEAITTSHLRKPKKFNNPVTSQITFISTSADPSDKRKKQLKEGVGLQISRRVRSRIWLKKLGVGIRKVVPNPAFRETRGPQDIPSQHS
jgi:hypothetical protein